MAAGCVTSLYDLADAVYDCKDIREFSESLGHVPLIDRNARGGEAGTFAPAEKVRYRERSAVERCNSELKDNYGARNVRVRGHLKVFLHLMLGVVALTSKAFSTCSAETVWNRQAGNRDVLGKTERDGRLRLEKRLSVVFHKKNG